MATIGAYSLYQLRIVFGVSVNCCMMSALPEDSNPMSQRRRTIATTLNDPAN